MGFDCDADDSHHDTVFMGNGIKIGEVTQNSAIIWARLTKISKLNKPGIKFNEFSVKKYLADKSISDEENGPKGGFASQLPRDVSLEEAEGAVPGTAGEVRLTWMERGKENSKKIIDDTIIPLITTNKIFLTLYFFLK